MQEQVRIRSGFSEAGLWYGLRHAWRAVGGGLSRHVTVEGGLTKAYPARWPKGTIEGAPTRASAIREKESRNAGMITS